MEGAGREEGRNEGGRGSKGGARGGGGREETGYPVRFEYCTNMSKILPSNTAQDILKNYSLLL